MKRFLLFLFLFCPMIAIGQNKTDSVSTDGGFSRFKLLANGVFSVRSIWAKTTGNTNRDVYTSVKIIFGEEKNTYQYCLDVNQTKEDKLVTLTTVKLGIEYDELVKINDAIASLRQDFNTDLADHTLARPTARNQRENYNVDIAIRDAAKVAYLVRLLQTGSDQVRHYVPEMDEELAGALIQNQSLNKLNRTKKISLEAFFYFLEIEKMAAGL